MTQEVPIQRPPMFPGGEEEAERFVRSLGCRWIGQRLRYFQSVDSTNTRGKRLAYLGWPGGTVILAEHQSRGRGRMGRKWLCPFGAGILVSVLVPPGALRYRNRCADSAEPASRLPWLTAAGALAMAKAVEACSGAKLLIDWPNDLVFPAPEAPCGFRKAGGVLAELRHGTEMAVLGIGLNVDVRAEEFPPELRDTAGSVADAATRRPDRREILGAFLPVLEAYLEQSDLIAEELTRRSCTLRRKVFVGERLGRAVGFDEAMRLLVEFPDGRTEAVAEVSSVRLARDAS